MRTALLGRVVVVGWFASGEIGGERLKDRRQARHVRQCVMGEEDPLGVLWDCMIGSRRSSIDR